MLKLKSVLPSFFLMNFLVLSSALFAQPKDAEDESKLSEGYGKKLIEINKQIKSLREEVAECRTARKSKPSEKSEKSELSKDSATKDPCEVKEEDLKKLRAERDEIVKAIPEGRGLGKELRKNIANDRRQERRENGSSPEADEDR
jgi:hypothetical protein